MKVDKNGLDFLRDREDLKLKAYLDSGGVPTIGIGSIKMKGKPVTMGMTCTVDEAYAQCALDLKATEDAINKLVKVPLNQFQFNALASFVYNIGITAFTSSTLLRKLNEGNYEAAASQFMRWVYDNGKYVEGLHNRRVFEQKLFSTK